MQISELNVFFLNLWRSPTYSKNSKLIHEYINELLAFSEFYLKQRYGISVKASAFWPYYVPKTYQDVKDFDANVGIHSYFGQNLQMYCGYGLQLRPDGEHTNTIGKCECVPYAGKPGTLQLRDFMYCDMPEYDAKHLVSKSIYWQNSEFSRAFFHELDHQIGWLLGANWFLSGVHKAALMPLQIWYLQDIMPKSTSERYTNAKYFVTDKYFVTQQDPSKV